MWCGNTIVVKLCSNYEKDEFDWNTTELVKNILKLLILLQEAHFSVTQVETLKTQNVTDWGYQTLKAATNS